MAASFPVPSSAIWLAESKEGKIFAQSEQILGVCEDMRSTPVASAKLSYSTLISERCALNFLYPLFVKAR